MRPVVTSSQKAAAALRRAEKALRNWQDDPDSPRSDVDKMLHTLADLCSWTQGHVLADLERAQERSRSARASALSAPAPGGETAIAETPETYDHRARDED